MKRLITISTLILSLALSSAAFAASGDAVIVRCDGGCDAAVSSIQSAGGSITYRYKYVDALAATIPSDRYGEVGTYDGVRDVYKDLPVKAPRSLETVELGNDAQAIEGVALEQVPDDYFESTLLTGVGPLFGAGQLGDDVRVAVIDTGTANVPAFSRGGCATGGPTVIGGETFIASADPTEPSATSPDNGPHGTWVGTTIAANTVFGFANGSTIAQSVATHSPSSAIVDIAPGVTGIPMLGTAPCARVYALKVFPAAGGGAPTSDVVAAMERAIELRENFNNGLPESISSGDGTAENPFVFGSLDIDVVNMSLGGPTLFAAMDVDDLLTEKMLDVGITIVTSAGNEGHAAMTGGSAGTGRGSLTAGAASLTHNERILRDLQFGLGIGALYRASDHHQMATFSSRGPSADGRISTDAVANGFANFVMGAAGGFQVVSGTSFSAPTIAGAAATLHGAMPNAGGLLVRNALVETADPGLLGDNSAPVDQGQGFINAAAAFAALQNGSVSTDLPSGPGSNSVKGNIASVGVNTIEPGKNTHTEHLSDLVPGQVAHLFVNTSEKTDALVISFKNITPALPPAQQNLLFGDDIFVGIQDAVTSDEAYLDFGSPFLSSDTTVVFENPQTGIVRIAVMGDWTNAGSISADVEITEITGKKPSKTAHGRLDEGEFDLVEVDVPAGTAQANFELRWSQDWGAYPTDDLDLIVFDPNGDPIIEIDEDGNPFLPGSTLASPERVSVDSPIAGTYTVLIDGFTVWGERGNTSKYDFSAFDGDGNAF